MSKPRLISFLSAEQPFMWSRQGWKLFLKVRETSQGPLRTYRGVVLVDANRKKISRAICLEEEVECPRLHSTSTAALLDAIDLSHVVLNVIDTALDAANIARDRSHIV